MKEYQILKIEPLASPARWTFWSNGLAIDETKTKHVVAALKGRGCRVQLIEIPKD